MIKVFKKNKLITKLIIVIILIAHFSCYISLAAEMSADNLTYLTNNIVAWKHIDKADVILADGQDIANLQTKRTVKIQEQEEEIIQTNKLDLCLILDCSGSMYTKVENTTRMDKLKFATKNLLKGLSNDFQVRVSLITYGEKFDGPMVGVNAFSSNIWNMGWYGGRLVLNFEKDMNKILEVIDNLEIEWITPTGEAINFADSYWNRSQSIEASLRKTVLVTDGEPNRSY